MAQWVKRQIRQELYERQERLSEMAQAAVIKNIKEPDETLKSDAEAKAKSGGHPLVGTIIVSLAGVIGTAVLALGLGYAAHLTTSRAVTPPSAPSFVLVAAGSDGIVWRLNTMTGEMIACRSLGPAGILPNELSGAGCWQVRPLKTAMP